MLLSTNPHPLRATLFSAFTFISLILFFTTWLVFNALAASTITPPSSSESSPATISLRVQEFATGLNRPVKVTHAGDTRLFVVEQPGVIRIVQPDGTVLESPFLDIQDRVNDGANERGLLGLAFEPDDPSIFYVNYTLEVADSTDERNGNTIIARYRVSSTDPNVADPTDEEVILEIDQPYRNHNAGDLAFGPDKLLYIPLGDGGSSGDPDENGQDLSKLLGKMLRIDVIGQVTYTIPVDNPYVNDNDPNTRDEIWASGLRNPWRFSFDRQTNDIYMGDVGQGAWEEVNFQPSTSTGGENYGWDCYEGNHDYELNDPNDDCSATYTIPIFEYARSENQSNPSAPCSSITGGYVYRGSAYPNLQGYYIVADYCSGKFWSVIRNAQEEWISTAHGKLMDAPSSFGEDVQGELYVTSLDGIIYRVVDPLAALTERLYLPIVRKDGTN